MCNRELLDELLPDNEYTRYLASKVIGQDLTAGYRTSPGETILACLEWSAKFTEEHRSSPRNLDWQMQGDHPLYDPGFTTWPMSIHGLQYKNSSCYLTNEGWGTGTTCWYVVVEGGHRDFICAETPHLAIMRGVIVAYVLANNQCVAPKFQPPPYVALKQFVLENLGEYNDIKARMER